MVKMDKNGQMIPKMAKTFGNINYSFIQITCDPLYFPTEWIFDYLQKGGMPRVQPQESERIAGDLNETVLLQ